MATTRNAFEEAKKRWLARRQAGLAGPKKSSPTPKPNAGRIPPAQPPVRVNPVPPAQPPVRVNPDRIPPAQPPVRTQTAKTEAQPNVTAAQTTPPQTSSTSDPLAEEKAAWALVAKGGSVGALGYLKLANMAVRDGNAKYALEFDKRAKNLLRAEAGLPALSRGGSVQRGARFIHGRPTGTSSMEEHMRALQKLEEQARKARGIEAKRRAENAYREATYRG